VDWFRRHPLLAAVAVVVPVAAIGYSAAVVATGNLEDTLLTATTGFIFGAFFGGIVKLWLDDYQRARDRRDKELELEREQRAEQARFVTAVLADLKSVYDKVERVRILIAAHRSALTYGNEMRDLIDSEVQLRNVIRALDQATSGIPGTELGDLRLAVRSMETYLKSLTGEFRDKYKPIADRQRIYEAQFKRLLDEHRGEDWSAIEPPPNRAWSEIEDLPTLREFRGLEAPGRSGHYARDFVLALDLASWILRRELKRPAETSEPEMPSDLCELRDRLRKSVPAAEANAVS